MKIFFIGARLWNVTTFLKGRSMKRSPEALSARLQAGYDCFERWRRRHRPHSRIPEHLWSLATELAGEFGLHRTAKILRLDYYGLKKRLEQHDGPEASTTQTASFLELKPLSSSLTHCSVTCRDPAGLSLEVNLQGHDITAVTTFCIQLWQQGR
jgi:hypothetical protein